MSKRALEIIRDAKKVLDLSGQEIDGEQLQNVILPELKEKAGVQKLILNNNRLGDGGRYDEDIGALFNFLKSKPHIYWVELNQNYIGEAGIKQLIASLVGNEAIQCVSMAQQKNVMYKITSDHVKFLMRKLAERGGYFIPPRENEASVVNLGLFEAAKSKLPTQKEEAPVSGCCCMQ